VRPRLELRGSLLGVFDQAEFAERTIQLERGDKLLIYSDGADRFIGSYNDQVGFHFQDEFCELTKLPITGILDNQEVDVSEVDDITGVGLEIL